MHKKYCINQMAYVCREFYMKMSIFNTASKKKEAFSPFNGERVGIYSCGLTVYYYSHIGNLRTYVNSDILRRTIEFLGWKTCHVMNVTDVGHLTSDEDEGDDKIEVGARREGKDPWEIARFYEEYFFHNLEQMNISHPHIICRATEHIEDMISLIKRLEKLGYTYRTDVGLIFDTSKYENYGKFARLDLNGQQHGFRVQQDPQRRQPWDFALWVTNQPKHIMHWDSPWGDGFPGWHIECSAMSMKYLGEQIDIHTGGIDHINVHHTNEIAQSEAATGKQFVKYWFHSAFMNIDGRKMSKSIGNLYTLDDLASHGYSPLALRYFFLGSSYRKTMNFTWEALSAAQTALTKLWQKFLNLGSHPTQPLPDAVKAFTVAMCDDINTPKALAILWDTVDSNHDPDQIAATLIEMDRILGLDFINAAQRLAEIRLIQTRSKDNEDHAFILARERDLLRKDKKFAEADVLRVKIQELGYLIEDTPQGFRIIPKAPDF